MRLLPLKEQHGIMGVYCPPTARWHLPAGFRPGLNVVTVRLKSWDCQHAPNPTSPVSHDSRGVTHGWVTHSVWKLATIPVGLHTTLFILSLFFTDDTQSVQTAMTREHSLINVRALSSLSQNKFHLKRGFCNNLKQKASPDSTTHPAVGLPCGLAAGTVKSQENQNDL